MTPPSQLSIATSSLQRLVKEEASYYKELLQQEARLEKTQGLKGHRRECGIPVEARSKCRLYLSYVSSSRVRVWISSLPSIPPALLMTELHAAMTQPPQPRPRCVLASANVTFTASCHGGNQSCLSSPSSTNRRRPSEA